MSQQLDDLSPDAARILRIWRRSRPHAVMALRKSGKLRERLEAVAAALETGREMYLRAGLDPQSAEFEAMKDQVYLPDASDRSMREESGRVIHDWDPPQL